MTYREIKINIPYNGKTSVIEKETSSDEESYSFLQETRALAKKNKKLLIIWSIMLMLTIAFAVCLGRYNRDGEKNETLFVFSWIFLGLDISVFFYGFISHLRSNR